MKKRKGVNVSGEEAGSPGALPRDRTLHQADVLHPWVRNAAVHSQTEGLETNRKEKVTVLF